MLPSLVKIRFQIQQKNLFSHNDKLAEGLYLGFLPILEWF